MKTYFLLGILMVVLLSANESAAQSATFIDVTDPPGMLASAIPNDGNDDTSALQGVIDYVVQSGRQATIYMPPSDGSGSTSDSDGYELHNTLDITGAEGITILGAGRYRGGGAPLDAYTKITWHGNASGPVVHIKDANGLVLNQLNVWGNANHESLGPDVLIQHEDVATGSSTSQDLHMEDCSFVGADRLWYNKGTGENGHLYFENCFFRGNHGANPLDFAGFYGEGPNSLVLTFDHCIFNFLSTCIYLEKGGRLQVYGGGVNQCRRWIHRETRDQDWIGISTRDLFVDAGGKIRMVWYSTGNEDTEDNDGNILFDSVHLGSNYPNGGENFVEVTSFTGNNLQLASGLDMVVGQQVAFFDEGKYDERINANAIATITSRISVNQYTLDKTVSELGITAGQVNSLEAAHGDPLFALTGGEQLVVRDCSIRNQVIRGLRLCSLKKSFEGDGRIPIAHFIRVNYMRYDPLDLNDSLVDKYLWIKTTGPGNYYYRFKDCQEEVSGDPPVSISNIP